MTEPTVLFDVREHVGIVSLNRPERHNALDDATSALFAGTLQEAIASDEVLAILLRGEGPSFCSGRDTSQLGQRAAGESDFAFVRHHQERRLRLLDCAKPVVAALRGHTLGGGLETALAADVRIAATDVRMGLPEVAYGLVPDTGGTQVLTSLIGPARAKLMIIGARPVDAATGLQWGLVDQVVDPVELDDTAFDVARRFAQAPPLAAVMAKQLVDMAWSGRIREGIRAELLAQVALFASADYAEAKAARSDNRPPRYQGR
ncbi:MAG: enoyl-CoA hydratase/isomerase family protein [Acidimicrobiales bacterium]